MDQILGKQTTRLSSRRLIDLALWDNLLPLAAVACGVAIISGLGLLFGFEVNYSMYSLPMLFFGPSCVIVPLLAALFWAVLTERPQRPMAFAAAKLAHWKVMERAVRGLPILVFFPVYFSVFTSYKSALGHIVPFYFDPYARYLDQVLHGGDAWKLIQPLTGHPFITFLFNAVYNIWFFILFLMLAVAAFVISDLRFRARFLTAFVLCWFLIGVVAATALASAGPCYYLHFHGDAAFNYIRDYLVSVAEHYPIPALRVQDHLLNGFMTAEPGLGEGISAAPSMHVSVATLAALLGARYGRVAGLLGWGYCAIILLASVQLGWHYAIDGYLAVILTLLIWMGSGRLADLYGPRPQSQASPRTA